MKHLLICLLKVALWIFCFPFMLVYALFKSRKLLITILSIVFFPIAIVVAVFHYLLKGV